MTARQTMAFRLDTLAREQSGYARATRIDVATEPVVRTAPTVEVEGVGGANARIERRE
jgi:hypothetical protein